MQMAIDTNELLHRIGAVLRVISDKMDRLIKLGEAIERASRSQEMPVEWGEHPDDHFAGADKMVADEPAKEPEHPAGPKPDPGEGYRLLSKDPEESLHLGDEYELAPGRWVKSENAGWTRMQDPAIWYRRKIEPAEPLPAWEPKVGDWVRVTRPQNWEECRDPDWLPIMHEYHDKVMQVSSYENRWGAWCAKCDGVDWFFHRDWLTPSIQYFAEPPEIDKPLETEYQRPSLPEDAGKLCEFSDDGESWVKGYLKGFDCDRHWNEGTGWLRTQNFLADRARHRFARIKKES